MSPSPFLATGFAILLLAGCGGDTTVTGADEGTGTTGPTAATAATGASATTGPVEGNAAFSLELGEYPPEVQEVAFFTCEGLEGVWRYVFRADFGPGVAFDVDEQVDMAGGEGTLVFSGEFDVAGLGPVTWTDTVDLRLVGTRAMEATSVQVEIDTNIPGLNDDLFDTLLPEGRALPILDGSDRC